MNINSHDTLIFSISNTPYKTVKVKTGGRKYVIRLCFPKSGFEINAFEVECFSIVTLLFDGELPSRFCFFGSTHQSTTGLFELFPSPNVNVLYMAG